MNDPRAPIHVLHVDDDPDFVALVADVLESQYDRFTVDTATDVDSGLDRLEDVEPVDCVVSDYEMPSLNGIEFLDRVRDGHPDLPFILYTGRGSEEVASEAISAGVTEYLQKETGSGQYDVLANRITNAVSEYRARSALERSQRRLSLFIDQSPLGVIEWDDDFRAVRVNEAAEEILGYDEADLVGRTWETLVPEAEGEQVGEVVSALLTGEGGYHSINENVRADGERIVCEWHNRIVENEVGETVAIFSQFQDVTERTREQRELQRYEAYVQGSSDIITVLDAEGQITYQSPSVQRTLGYESDALVGENGFEYVHPDDRERMWDAFEDLVTADRETVTVECRFQRADGEYRWLEVRGRDCLDDPVVEGVVTNNRDITERKERERDLEEVNVLLSTLIENLPVGVLAEDSDRQVLAVNDRFLDDFDVDRAPADVRGTDCAELAGTVADRFEESAAVADRIEELIAAREPVTADIVRRTDGRVFERSYQPLELPEGEGHLWIYRDVTDRESRTATLRQTRHRLEALNRATRDLLAAEDEAGVAETGVALARDLLDLDAAAIHLYDEDADALVPAAATEFVTELIGEPPTFREGNSLAWEAYAAGEVRTVDEVGAEADAYNPDSVVRSELLLPIGDHGVLLAGSPTPAAFDEQDELLGDILAGNVATALDHVAQTRALRERERRLREQNDRLEEFASVVSHDLRNPLNVAAGRLELLAEECDSEHVADIERAHDRMAALVEDLLQLARVGETEPTTVDLAAVVSDCWQTVATGDATLSVEGDVSLRADENRFRQLLENLLANAVEHGGEDVSVTVGPLPDGFYVEDDGPGIPATDREDVFEAGYSTTDAGTGFGLRIVERVASDHGWTVTVTEGDAGGARFEITGVELV